MQAVGDEEGQDAAVGIWILASGSVPARAKRLKPKGGVTSPTSILLSVYNTLVHVNVFKPRQNIVILRFLDISRKVYS